jgi:large subunit ribosomal protein L21
MAVEIRGGLGRPSLTGFRGLFFNRLGSVAGFATIPDSRLGPIGEPPVYAIIEDSGTQIKVAKGDVIDIDLRELKTNAKKLTFERVLMVGDAGSEATSTIGTPYVEGASVSAEIVGPVQGEKLRIGKYKRRKGYRRKAGHTQGYLRVKIDSIKA